jgi:RHS repeat-associated protein
VDGESITIKKHYYAGMQQIAVRTIVDEVDEGVQWILTDHLGSTSVVADEDGSLVSQVKYTAFGEVRAVSGEVPTDYKYTGQLEQAEIGLYYYVARWYDPYLGQWVQPDSIAPKPNNPIAWGRYTYVLQNPLKYNDPFGHYEFEVEPTDNYFIPGTQGIMPGRRSTGDRAYTHKERLKLIDRKADILKRTEEDSLEAFSLLMEYADTLYSDLDPKQKQLDFMTDMTCVINGYCDQKMLFLYRLGNWPKEYNVKGGEYFLGDEYFEGQGSWSSKFYDFTDNQMFHFWFYAAVSYFYGYTVSIVANEVHDPPQESTFVTDVSIDGISAQDYLLGVSGTTLGFQIRIGSLRVGDISDWIRENLSE